MQKIAIGVEYIGTDYCGWQRQDHLKSVQGSLEGALSRVANHAVSVVCAGRTDAGVHASGQVVHFESNALRSPIHWIRGGNSHLPDSITIQWAQPVDNHFHARFSATARRYQYVIYNHPVRSSIFHQNTTWWYKPLNEVSMQEATNYWLGEHDFSAFRAINCQAKTAIRTISHIAVKRFENFIVIEVKANAFLHHMVRNIVGVLIEIGEGKKPIQWAQEVLLGRCRKDAGITAPPTGLCLTEVEYPQVFSIPRQRTLYDVRTLFATI